MQEIITERCQIKPRNAAHLKEALTLFTSPAVREFLGGPLPEEFAKKRLAIGLHPRTCILR